MNDGDTRLADESALVGSVAAIQRAVNAAEDTAIRTNTSIIIPVNGQTRRITDAELIEMRSAEAQVEKGKQAVPCEKLERRFRGGRESDRPRLHQKNYM